MKLESLDRRLTFGMFVKGNGPEPSSAFTCMYCNVFLVKLDFAFSFKARTGLTIFMLFFVS